MTSVGLGAAKGCLAAWRLCVRNKGIDKKLSLTSIPNQVATERITPSPKRLIQKQLPKKTSARTCTTKSHKTCSSAISGDKTLAVG